MHWVITVMVVIRILCLLRRSWEMFIRIFILESELGFYENFMRHDVP